MTDPAVAVTYKSASKPSYVAYVLVILALGFVFVLNVRWLKANTAPPIWDEARYLVNSLEAYDLVSSPSLKNLAELYTIRHEVRPSIGYVWLAVPIYSLLGTDPDALTLWTNFILLVIIAFATFGVGWRLFNVKAGMLASVLVTVNPELVRLTRVYWPHLGVVAVATLGVYFLVRSDTLRRKWYAVWLGILIGAGLMMRPIHPAVFLAGPVAFTFMLALYEIWVARRQARDAAAGAPPSGNGFLQRIIIPAVLVVVPALLIALPFYLKFGTQMVRYSARFQTSGTFAPVENVLSVASFAWYAAHLNSSISLPLAVLFFGGLIVYLVALATRRVPVNTAVTLAWLVVPYLVLSLQATKEFFYLAPLYPAMILLMSFGVLYVLRRYEKLQLAVGAAMIAFSLLLLWQTSWGGPLSSELAGLIAIPARAPESADWRSREIINTIDSAAAGEETVTVGVVSALASSSEPPLTYYAKLADSPIEIIRWTDPMPTLLDAAYVVVKTGDAASPRPSTLKDTNATIVAKILQDPNNVFYSTHREMERFDLPDDSQAVVYQRVAPVTLDEAGQIADALKAVSINGPAVAQSRRDIKTAYLDYLYAQSEPLLAAERFEEAVGILERAVDFDPQNPRSNQDIARALLSMGDCDRAIQYQKTATQSLRTNGTFTVLGDMLSECGRIDGAIAAYQEAIAIDPDRVRTHFVLGRALMDAGDVEEALNQFDKVRQLDASGEFSARALRLAEQLKSQ